MTTKDQRLGRGLHRTAGAIKQRKTQVLFEFKDCFGDGRLRNVQGTSDSREISQIATKQKHLWVFIQKGLNLFQHDQKVSGANSNLGILLKYLQKQQRDIPQN